MSTYSPFASLVTKVLTVPGDPGQTITIRKLAPKDLTLAVSQSTQADQAVRVLIGVVERGGTREGSDLELVRQEVNKDPLLLFDRVTLIDAGVIGWTYEQERSHAKYEDLDDDTQTWLARAILRLAKPSLFQGPAEAESEQKKGDGVASVA